MSALPHVPDDPTGGRRYVVAWRDRVTGATGCGHHRLRFSSVLVEVERLDREFPESDHWVWTAASPLAAPSPDGGAA